LDVVVVGGGGGDDGSGDEGDVEQLTRSSSSTPYLFLIDSLSLHSRV
jgi:hypothetical protein